MTTFECPSCEATVEMDANAQPQCGQCYYWMIEQEQDADKIAETVEGFRNDVNDLVEDPQFTTTGNTHTDKTAALWVEISSPTDGATYWATMDREDLTDIMSITASVETLNEIPEAQE